MNNKKYKLTISLLASNRKDTLPKTLASLKPILDNVSSELIVVDTGCDEDLLEIVRQYTDKIIKFEWCKDFSKARNVGIDNAQGDWFMFIDDDEWFEDTTEFIDFFNSDEMKKYNYGKYVVRNYEDMEGTAWTDSIAGRMFRLFEGTRFIDAIHERPTNIAGPTKDFTSYAHHYGYVYKSEEDKRAHIKRNTELLLEQVKKEPIHARHYCHLVQEYNVIKEYEKSMEYALAGIENADMSIKDNVKDVPGLYGNVVWVMVNQLRYEEAIEQAEKYMADKYANELCKMSLCGFCATAAYKLGKYQLSIDYAEKFFDLNRFFIEYPDKLYAQNAVIIAITVTPENVERINGVAFVAALMMGNVTVAKRYSDNMEKGPRALIDADKCMKHLPELIGQTGNCEDAADILRKIMLNAGYFAIVLNRVEELREENVEAFLKIADAMALIETNHGYVQFMRIISKRNESEELLYSLYEKAIRDINDVVNLHHHFWSIAANRKINIADMIAKKPLNKWISTVDDWAVNIKINKLFEKKQDLSQVLYPNGIHMKYFDMVIVESLMYRKKLEGITLDGLRDEILRYANVVLDFYREIYRENVFVDYPTMLPNRCQLALYIKKICDESEVDVGAEFKEATKIAPAMKRIAEKYMELLN